MPTSWTDRESKQAGIELTGDPSVLGRLFALLEDPDPDFAIVTPAAAV